MMVRGAFHGATSEIISHVAPRVPGVQPFDLGFVAGGLVVLLLVLLLFAIVIRKLLRKGTAMPEGEFTAPIPDPENAVARSNELEDIPVRMYDLAENILPTFLGSL